MTDTLPIYEQARAARYPGPSATQRGPTPSGGTVSIATDIETGIEDVKAFVGDHLGGILQRAAQLEASPVVAALEDAALGPEFEALVAEWVTKVAAWAHALPAPAPAADVPAETAGDPYAPVAEPGSVFETQAGPVVAGQA